MDSFFEFRNCPNCGEDNSTVIFNSNMEKADLQKERAVFLLCVFQEISRSLNSLLGLSIFGQHVIVTKRSWIAAGDML